MLQSGFDDIPRSLNSKFQNIPLRVDKLSRAYPKVLIWLVFFVLLINEMKSQTSKANFMVSLTQDVKILRK